MPGPGHAEIATESNCDGSPSIEPRVAGGTGSTRSARPRWLQQVCSWLSVSEPSAQAMREQKRSTYERHGIDPGDPQAAAKMHLPVGKVPAGVPTATGGPSPEKALRERTRDWAARKSYWDGGASRSASSGISSDASTSTRGANQIAPWT